MKLILLPGNSVSNKEWIKEVEKTLSEYFDSTETKFYHHWGTDQDLINLKKESESLVKMVQGIDNYIIFAKSAGISLALKNIYEKKIFPSKCIFVGTPVHWSRHHGFHVDTWLKDYSTPTLFIQKTSDPAISFIDLKNLLAEKTVKGHEIIEVLGDSHHYEDLREIKVLAGEFMHKSRF